MKKRILTIILLIVAATFVAEANPVDLRTAQEVVVKFMNANSEVPLRGAEDLQLVTIYNISRGDVAFYVFNTPNGYVIVSADDCATPILGYSDEGQFDVNNIPIQLQDYLQDFVEQIQYGIENHLEADEQTVQQWELVRTVGRLTNSRSDEVVEPLLTTRWGQRYPYNMFVPSGCPTGCVATAMAQIMKYWEWPMQGTGEHSYQWNGQTLSANFGETIYDWDNMIDNYYYSQSTQEQKEAVATLMWHCGVSVDMDYSPDGSGAGLNPGTLINYFNYSYEMNGESLNNCSVASWKARLKDCLDLGRPVFYTGVSSSNDGHAFVCDGFDTNDMFHFNWGWSGSGDGYFSIGALNVSSYDYNYYNSAIFNIHPQGETTYYTINISVNNDEGGSVLGGGTFAHGDNVTLTAIANDGYGFCYWEENGGIASTDPNYSFTANYNRDLVAIFAGPFTVTTSTEEGGTVSGGGSFYYGEPCLVTAMPDEGYVFAYWTNDGDVFSYNPNYTFAVTGETHLVAHFVELSDDIIVFADGYVKDLCVTNWDTNGDGLLSYDEAAVVTSIGEVFRGNTTITSFDELQYFTNLSAIGDYAFYYCRNLTLLTIPSSITSIGEFAFCGCNNMTGTLTIPNSVTTIGICAFDGCRSLTGSLTIPNSVTTIGNQAFRGCSGFTGNLIIPNSITEIDYYTFYGCSGLSGSLILPNTITSIGDYAFYNCRNLTGSLTIPNSVTIIGESAFRGCSGFTGSLTISDSITEIGNYAFSGCSGLSGLLTIPNTITSIEDYTFYNCRNLTSLIVPNTISIINDYAFSGCSGLKSIYVYAETPPIVGIDTYHNVTTNIQVYVPCDDVESYQTSEGWNLFSNIFGMCYGIITAESNPMDGGEITGSGSYEGGDCCTLVATPNEGYCFANWKENGNVISLDSTYSFIVIGERTLTAHFVLDGIITFADSNVKAICVANWDTNGDGELSNAEALAVTSLGIVFRNNSEITSFEELQYFINLTSINNYAFYNCSGLTSVTIPQSVTSIGNYAFYNCRGFTGNLIIPNSVTSIGNYAFSGCSGFNGNLTISNSVTLIGNSAFSNCSGFTGNLTIPDSVTSIGDNAFYYCNGFTGDLTIGNSMVSIGGRAFNNCSGIISMIVFAETPPIVGASAFYNISTSIPVYVSCESVEDYQSAEGWNAFSNIMCISSGTISVVADPFEGGEVSGTGTYEGGTICTVTASPNEGYCFANWTKNNNLVSFDDNYSFVVASDYLLTAHFVMGGNIDFADTNVKAICVAHWDANGDGELSYAEAASVMSLGEVFRGNTEIVSFEELKYFISLTAISNYAFYNCSGLTGSLTIPNTVTSIGNYAFYNCSGLTSIEIPNSATSIGSSAFRFCRNLTSITVLAGNPPILGSNAFYNVTTRIPVCVPCGSEEVYTVANWGGFSNFVGLCGGEITVTANLVEGGTVTGEGFYGDDAICTLTATPLPGYSFINWTNNGVGVSRSETYSFYVSGDASYVAHFAQGTTITFADANVKALCVANWDTDSDGELSYAEAASVTDLGTVFRYKSNITNFDELQYFIGLTSIGSTAFESCIGLVSIEIPSFVTSISSSAFRSDSSLTSIVIPNSVTIIGSSAFYYCSSLTTIEISNSVTSIGSSAFQHCSGLMSIEIPNSVTSIGYQSFSSCSSLTSIEIPNSVTTICDYAFNYCVSLSSITVLAETPPTIYSSTFSYCPKSIPLYVLCGCVEAYQSAMYWNEFTNIQEDCHEIVHFITAGNWSEASNWSGGALPGANDEVFIDALCQMDMDATVASLSVSNGQSLTLQSGQTLTVTNALINAVTTGLVIEDGAQLVHASENVSAMVKKNIVGHGTNNGKYSLISNPLTTVVDPEMSSVYHLITGDYDLYDWLPNASDHLEWRNYKTNDFMMLPEGYGYLYANRNGVELNFPGILKPSNNRCAKNVSYDSNDTDHPGWNLIGNPFVCNAYLVDEEGTPLPYYRMNATGNGFEAVAPCTPIAPMEGVFYKAFGNGTVYFIRIVPSESADKTAKQAKRTVKEINDNIEHSTLGDLEVLAGLKENLEKQEKAQKGE